jgi:Pyridoxamine 5'-phosphate oxidase
VRRALCRPPWNLRTRYHLHRKLTRSACGRASSLRLPARTSRCRGPRVSPAPHTRRTHRTGAPRSSGIALVAWSASRLRGPQASRSSRSEIPMPLESTAQAAPYRRLGARPRSPPIGTSGAGDHVPGDGSEDRRVGWRIGPSGDWVRRPLRVSAVNLGTMRRRVEQARVARLATITPDGRPHVVPCCFVLSGSVLYSAVDSKPKSSDALQRVRNLRALPLAALLVDHYAEDWSVLLVSPVVDPG